MLVIVSAMIHAKPEAWLFLLPVFAPYLAAACYGIWRWRGLQSEIRNPKSAITPGERA
jgi:hypothetical protein